MLRSPAALPVFSRDGVDLDRSTLAGWVGKATALLEPLADAVGRHVLAGRARFADDTPVKLLAPGTGRTATGRVWTYVRDERPSNGEAPPAAWYRFSADRKAAHPKGHLEGFAGWMHTGGYAGFGALARAGSAHDRGGVDLPNRPTVHSLPIDAEAVIRGGRVEIPADSESQRYANRPSPTRPASTSTG